MGEGVEEGRKRLEEVCVFFMKTFSDVISFLR